MAEKKNTCPICFTKLQPRGKELVCPECGYKLCDHSYQNRDLYSTSHSHTPQYTTTSKQYTTTGSARPSGSYTTNNRNSSGSNGSAGTTVNKSALSKVIGAFVILYIIVIFLSVFGSLFASIFF